MGRGLTGARGERVIPRAITVRQSDSGLVQTPPLHMADWIVLVTGKRSRGVTNVTVPVSELLRQFGHLNMLALWTYYALLYINI